MKYLQEHFVILFTNEEEMVDDKKKFEEMRWLEVSTSKVGDGLWALEIQSELDGTVSKSVLQALYHYYGLKLGH